MPIISIAKPVLLEFQVRAWKNEVEHNFKKTHWVHIPNDNPAYNNTVIASFATVREANTLYAGLHRAGMRATKNWI